MSVVIVNENNFDEVVLKSSVPVLVDFWAEWCGPCRAMAPILDQFASEHEGKMTVAKLNVDENQALAAQYQITAIPAMKLFRDGAVADELIGTRPKPQLEAELAKYL